MSYAKNPIPHPLAAETRTGVQHLEVGEDGAGQRLDNWLQRRLGSVPRSRIYRVIRKGEVRVNGRRAAPELRLQMHDRIRIPPVRLAPPELPGRPSPDLSARIENAIVHEDQDLLVLDTRGSGASVLCAPAPRASPR